MVGGAISAVNARAGRRVVIWGVLLAALALVLNFVPLFDLLGYDYAFAIGLAAALASVDIGCGIVAASRRHRAPAESAAVFRLAARAAMWSSAVLAAPLLLSLLNAFHVRNCNLASGLGFFLLLPVSTVLFASGAGVLCGLLLPRRGRVLAFALPVLSILWTLARLYLDPPVFAYDPFGGYFPGPIYDEALRPSATFLNFRLCNVVWIGAALSVAWAASRPRPEGGPPAIDLDVRRWRRLPSAVALALVLAGAALFHARASLGFHLGRTDLTRILDGERRSARIVLRYATAAAPSTAELDLTMEDLDYRYDQLRNFFLVEPDRAITVYQFANAEEKKALVGAGATLYAKPWTREIFVQGEQFPSHRLRHEMAHVFAAAFGDPIFGVAFRIRWKGPIPVPRLASGLIEGIAEAADFTDPDGGSTTHQEAAAIIADGRATPLAALMGAGFSTQSGPRAYTLAGSFTRYLFESRGSEKLKAIYRSAGDFPAVYGASLESLESEWRAFLSKEPVSAEQRARAREQFRRPAIFKKVCAREQAARIVQARASLGFDPKGAIHLLEQACQDDPGEPNLRVELAQAWATTGNSPRALEILGLLARDGELTSPVRARTANLTAAIQFHMGDLQNTREALRDVLAAATDEGERRQATAKLRALDDEPARRTLGRALFGNDVNGSLDPVLAFYLLSEFSRLHPEEALGQYLVGRQLAFRDPASAMPHLRAACEGTFEGQALSADFRRECLRLTMLSAYRVGDLMRSATAARTLATESREEADRMRAVDFMGRIAWRQAKQ